MRAVWGLFIGTFTTLLAIINPLESLPVFLGLMRGKSQAEQRSVARRACTYSALMMIFFMLFGTLALKVFGVPLSMVRIVGGIILVRIGFNLFMPPAGAPESAAVSDGAAGATDVAFVPLAIPLMFGPGALATVIGMSALVPHPFRQLFSLGAILAAIVASMVVTYVLLAYAHRIVGRIGAKGIDAATRLVGFFVSAMGMGLVFHGLVDALITYGVIQAAVPR